VADRRVDVLIAGAGGAGSACAEGLREGGFDGSILLVGRDVDPPYDRPYCSKDYLRGDVTREETYLALPDDLELLTRVSVTGLDTDARVAKLSSGEEVEYGQALLAPGANVHRLRMDGCQLEGIHYLRVLGNSDAIRSEAERAERVVLVGGSFIACEVAASLTVKGKQCTLVMPEESPLSLALGRTAGEFFGRVLRSHGVEWFGGEPLERFEGEGDRVRRVVTGSGRELECDMVVMGTGAVPDVTLARSAGLALGDSGGIACSSTLETSAARVFAAGDACEYD
jgi:3-phenylpropionate/trans-cinnamate dioxygenase ferredoxin reductase component